MKSYDPHVELYKILIIQTLLCSQFNRALNKLLFCSETAASMVSPEECSSNLSAFLWEVAGDIYHVLQRTALTILSQVEFLPARYITLVLMSRGVGRRRSDQAQFTGIIRHCFTFIITPPSLVFAVCRSAVLAYSNKCAAEAEDAAALLKINCLL